MSSPKKVFGLKYRANNFFAVHDPKLQQLSQSHVHLN